MNRRQFLVVLGSSSVAAALTTRAETSGEPFNTQDTETLDAGPVSDLVKDAVNAEHREQGFFVIRRGDDVFALSSICTHKGCKVRVQDDQSYICKCHKSHFDADGKVLNGPATRDLPRLAVKLSDDRHVLVKVPKRPA